MAGGPVRSLGLSLIACTLLAPAEASAQASKACQTQYDHVKTHSLELIRALRAQVTAKPPAISKGEYNRLYHYQVDLQNTYYNALRQPGVDCGVLLQEYLEKSASAR